MRTRLSPEEKARIWAAAKAEALEQAPDAWIVHDQSVIDNSAERGVRADAIARHCIREAEAKIPADVTPDAIEIDGRHLRYQLEIDAFDYESTLFYERTRRVSRRKYLGLFGPAVETEEPVPLFRIYRDVTSPSLTKKEVREMIREQLELLDRRAEVERGELI